MATNQNEKYCTWNKKSLLERALDPGGTKAARTADVRVHNGAEPPGPLQVPVRARETEQMVNIVVNAQYPPEVEIDPRLISTDTTRVRDAMGSVVATLERLDVQLARIDFEVDDDLLVSAIAGLEVALYRYKRVIKDEASPLRLTLTLRGGTIPSATLKEGLAMGRAVNLARHLVNFPPNELNPETYSQFLKAIFSGQNIEIEIWDEKKLAAEKMNLILAVGRGSSTPPRLVHLRYRPTQSEKSDRPVAFVGKGITFDSGGLDLKTASGMRLMKKDMGGSAAVAALALWACETNFSRPADFYFAMAENSVGREAMRPGDVYTSRAGVTVEIHNTDAEGRLVLADAMDVAITAKEKPAAIIDVATLTGAIKTALGTQIAGLFSNDQAMANSLLEAGQRAGDLSWWMPLVQKYKRNFESPFADIVNATDGWAGAITAALFLQRFVGDVPWAHLDIYAWRDAPEGACLEAGGSGQAVLGLIEWWSGFKGQREV